MAEFLLCRSIFETGPTPGIRGTGRNRRELIDYESPNQIPSAVQRLPRSGIFNDGTVSLTGDATITSNTVADRGGGIFNDGGTVNLIEGSVTGNRATLIGGGTRCEVTGDFSLVFGNFIGPSPDFG